MKIKDSKHFNFVVFTLIFGGLITSSVCELTLLKQKDAVHCFTNDSSALAWILPTGINAVEVTNDKSEWKTTSSSVSSPELEMLTCDLTSSDCSQWSGGYNISNYHIEKNGTWNLHPVQDYRWNNFPQFVTNGYDKKIKISMGSLPHYKMSIFHVSVLAEDNAHIYLIEGDNFQRNRLYWISLDSLTFTTGSTLSFIRKCPNGKVDDKKNPCSINRATQTGSPILKQGKSWINLSIHISRYQIGDRNPQKNEAIEIRIIADGEQVLFWNNGYHAFDINTIVLDTVDSKTAYWKYHTYNILTPKEGVTKISSPLITLSKPQHLCLSVIYYSTALAHLYLKNGEENLHTFELHEGKQWQVIKIKAKLEPFTFVLAFEFSASEYFHLGGMRLCHENDVFKSSLMSDRVESCEDLLSKSQVNYKRVTQHSSQSFQCLVDYFDRSCSLSCSAMLDTECKGVTTCGSDYCSCLSGYKSKPGASQCDLECIDRTFGPNCFFKCGHCVSNEACDIKTGHCKNGCEEIYRRPYCVDELPIFNITDDEIQTDFDNLKIEIDYSKQSKVHEIYFVLLQYKTQEDIGWRNISELQELTSSLSLSIQELESGVEYQVRVVLLEKDEHGGYQGYFGDKSPIVRVKTKCNVIDVAKIISSSTSSKISLNWEKDKHECPLSTYDLKVNGKDYKTTNILPIQITDLEPNTEYNIIMYHNDKIVFENKVNTETEETDIAVIVIPIIIIIIITLLILGILYWKRKNSKRSEDNQKINIDVSADTVTISGLTNKAGPESEPELLKTVPIELTNGNEYLIPPPLQPKAQTLPRNQSLTPQEDLINTRVSQTPPTKKKSFRKTDSRAGAIEKLSNPIMISDLENYVENCFSNDEFKKQHALFPRGQTQKWDYGRLQENKMKNRYGNLVAYDATRVKLAFLPGDPHSDYINANYIDGYKRPKSYIATQGPKANTVNDFWRMIWQENSNLIIMVANVVENGKAKCDKYWPDAPQQVNYGDIKIQALTEDVYADYTFRTFSVIFQGQIRKVTHLHYTTWPDHGVPFYPQTVTAFLKKILLTETTGPAVVHCSAGVGRTGTILLADSCLRMAAEEKRVDPLGLLQKMRAQRPNLVDNAEQYEFVHLVLLDCLLSDTTSFPCSKFSLEYQRLTAENSELLEQQYEKVNKLCNREMLRKRSSMEIIWPEEKSRYPDIAPGNYGRVLLASIQDGIDYINAVYVDGFRTKNQFIATQLPLNDTVVDLWHLVLQTKSPLIILLNKPQPHVDQTTCQFWPSDEEGFSLPDATTIVLKRQISTKLYDHLRLQIRCEVTEGGSGLCKHHDVNMLILNGWESNCEVPLNTYDIIQVWEEAERLYSGHGPIIVLCHDGARGCGLFLSSVFVVEKMKLEKEVDVDLAVRTTRLTRPQFITSFEQYKFIYEVAMMHQSACEAYANFQ